MHQIGYSGKPQLAGNLIELNFINYPPLKGGQEEGEGRAQGLELSALTELSALCWLVSLKHL